MIQVQAAPWTVFVQQSQARPGSSARGRSSTPRTSSPRRTACSTSSGAWRTPSAVHGARGGLELLGAASDRPRAGPAGQPRSASTRATPCTGRPTPDDVAVLALASPLDLSGPAVQAVALPSAGAAFPAGAAVGTRRLRRSSRRRSSERAALVDDRRSSTRRASAASSRRGPDRRTTAIISAPRRPRARSATATAGAASSRPTRQLRCSIGVVERRTTGCEPGQPRALRLHRRAGDPAVHPGQRPSADRAARDDHDVREARAGTRRSSSGTRSRARPATGSDPAASSPTRSSTSPTGRCCRAARSRRSWSRPRPSGRRCRARSRSRTTAAPTSRRPTPTPPVQAGAAGPDHPGRAGHRHARERASISRHARRPLGPLGKLAVCVGRRSRRRPALPLDRERRRAGSGVFPFIFNFRVKPTARLGSGARRDQRGRGRRRRRRRRR